MQEVRDSGYSGREDQSRRVQKQLLADVSAARDRRKHEFILEQLRKSMVTRRVVRPAYGEVLVYEHELQNPYSHEQVRGHILRRGEGVEGVRLSVEVEIPRRGEGLQGSLSGCGDESRAFVICCLRINLFPMANLSGE